MTYLQPFFPALLLLTAVGLFLCRRRVRGALPARIMELGLGGLFLFSWPPVAWVALRSLENPYPQRVLPEGEAQAIVVLASYVLPPTSIRPYPVLASDTYQRCLHAAWLYKHWRALPVLASGGDMGGPGPAYAASMREVLREEGIPEALLWTEERSRSTREAAVYTAEILRAKGIQRIALVTEAYHMPRAERCFRKAGLSVVLAPCRFHLFGLTSYTILPGSEAIYSNENVLHEWVGLGWYWLRGWI